VLGQRADRLVASMLAILEQHAAFGNATHAIFRPGYGNFSSMFSVCRFQFAFIFLGNLVEQLGAIICTDPPFKPVKSTSKQAICLQHFA